MNTEIIGSRLDDLISKAKRSGAANTGFLDADQQNTALRYLSGRRIPHDIKYFFYGGYKNAERRMLVLCDISVCSYSYCCRRCGDCESGNDFSALSGSVNGENPVSGGEYDPGDSDCFPGAECPFSELAGIKAVRICGSGYCALGHPAYMGAVLSLGLSRDTVGDIIVCGDSEAIILTARAAAELLLSQPPVLSSVGRDRVKVTETRLPEDFVRQSTFSEQTVTVMSARIDALVSELSGASREKSKRMIDSGLVTLNCKSEGLRPEQLLSEGDILSVRGCGKYKIGAQSGKTRSGRIRIGILRFR